MISTDQKETLMISFKGVHRQRQSRESQLTKLIYQFEHKLFRYPKRYLDLVNRCLKLDREIKKLKLIETDLKDIFDTK